MKKSTNQRLASPPSDFVLWLSPFIWLLITQAPNPGVNLFLSTREYPQYSCVFLKWISGSSSRADDSAIAFNDERNSVTHAQT
jgi:hypothetical protein